MSPLRSPLCLCLLCLGFFLTICWAGDDPTTELWTDASGVDPSSSPYPTRDKSDGEVASISVTLSSVTHTPTISVSDSSSQSNESTTHTSTGGSVSILSTGSTPPSNSPHAPVSSVTPVSAVSIPSSSAIIETLSSSDGNGSSTAPAFSNVTYTSINDTTVFSSQSNVSTSTTLNNEPVSIPSVGTTPLVLSSPHHKTALNTTPVSGTSAVTIQSPTAAGISSASNGNGSSTASALPSATSTTVSPPQSSVSNTGSVSTLSAGSTPPFSSSSVGASGPSTTPLSTATNQSSDAPSATTTMSSAPSGSVSLAAPALSSSVTSVSMKAINDTQSNVSTSSFSHSGAVFTVPSISTTRVPSNSSFSSVPPGTTNYTASNSPPSTLPASIPSSSVVTEIPAVSPSSSNTMASHSSALSSTQSNVSSAPLTTVPSHKPSSYQPTHPNDYDGNSTLTGLSHQDLQTSAPSFMPNLTHLPPRNSTPSAHSTWSSSGQESVGALQASPSKAPQNNTSPHAITYRPEDRSTRPREPSAVTSPGTGTLSSRPPATTPPPSEPPVVVSAGSSNLTSVVSVSPRPGPTGTPSGQDSTVTAQSESSSPAASSTAISPTFHPARNTSNAFLHTTEILPTDMPLSAARTTSIPSFEKLAEMFGWRKPGQRRVRSTDCGCPPKGQTIASVSPVNDTFPTFSAFAKVVFAYNESRFDEISIAPDDILTELHPVSTGWMKGCLRGRRGVFPSTYTRVK